MLTQIHQIREGLRGGVVCIHSLYVSNPTYHYTSSEGAIIVIDIDIIIQPGLRQQARD